MIKLQFVWHFWQVNYGRLIQFKYILFGRLDNCLLHILYIIFNHKQNPYQIATFVRLPANRRVPGTEKE
jgi:hypothetical protein